MRMFSGFREHFDKVTDGITDLSLQMVRRLPSQQSTSQLLGKLKGSILELMAKNMSERDQDYLLQKWKRPEIEKDESHEKKLNSSDESANIAKFDEEKSSPSASAIENCHSSSEGDELHPIFGRLVGDVGYKQVYLTSARRLILAQVWQKQRTLRPERSASIAQAKKASKTGFPGVITLYRDSDVDTVGIVDGQHRVGALLLMMQENSWPEDELNVLIEVYNFSSAENKSVVEDLFTEINSAEPVKAIDMPQESDEDQDVKMIINEVVNTIAKQNSSMFKPSSRCRPPHLHADSLREDLYTTNYLSRKKLLTVADALEHFHCLNLQLRENASADQIFSKEKALQKARKHNFFLGMSKHWLHEQ